MASFRGSGLMKLVGVEGMGGGGYWEWQEDGGVEEGEYGEGGEYTEARKARSLVNKVKQAEKMRRGAEERGTRKVESLL